MAALLTADDAVKLLVDLMFAGQPTLAVTLANAWRGAESAIAVADIARALDNAGLIDDDLAERLAASNVPFRDGVAAVGRSASTRALAHVERVTARTLDRELYEQRRELWIAEHGARLVRDLNARQRGAINSAIRRYSKDDLTPAEIAANVCKFVPLDERQAAAVLRLRERLAKRGVTPAEVEAAVARRIESMKAVRAERLVSTELAFAANQAALETVREAVETGRITAAIKIWYTQEDERVCSICGPLHETRRKLGADFPGGLDAPPAHPRCRCAVRFDYTPAPPPA